MPKNFAMSDFLSSHGIIHQHSCVYTLQQNLVMERKHQHLLSSARALQIQSQVPLQFWGDCVLTAAYLINKLPSPFWITKHLLSFYFISIMSIIISKFLVVCVLPLQLPTLETNSHQGQEDVFSLATLVISKVINSMILTPMLFLSQGMLFFMSLFFVMFHLPMILFISIHYLCHVFLLFLPYMMIYFCPNPTLLPLLLILLFKFIILLMMTFLMRSQKHPLIPLQILFPLEGLLDLLKDFSIYRSSTAIMLLLSSLCLLPNQVLLTLFLPMSHITIFLPHIRPFVVPFPPLLNLNFTIKLCLIPNGKLPWLLK